MIFAKALTVLALLLAYGVFLMALSILIDITGGDR